jgi:hypothetical protein
MKKMEEVKTITPTGKMSNLVGMWAIIMYKEVWKYTCFIYGKADDEYYIVQINNALTGAPLTCKLATLKQMTDWIFIPSQEVMEYCNRCRDKGQSFDWSFIIPST